MFKLFVLFGLLAVAFAAPKPEAKPAFVAAVHTAPVATTFSHSSNTVHHAPITTYAAAPAVLASGKKLINFCDLKNLSQNLPSDNISWTKYFRYLCD